MGEGSSMVRIIDRKSSIENEPRTLKINQIKYAREAALYVLNSTTVEEALKIFTEGLEEVESKTVENRDNIRDWDWNDDDDFDFDDFHRISRDIVTAPF